MFIKLDGVGAAMRIAVDLQNAYLRFGKDAFREEKENWILIVGRARPA